MAGEDCRKYTPAHVTSPTLTFAQYLPAFTQHKRRLDERRHEVIQAQLGYLPSFELPNAENVEAAFIDSCHYAGTRALTAHESGQVATLHTTEIERVMALVVQQIRILLDERPDLVHSRDLGIIAEGHESGSDISIGDLLLEERTDISQYAQIFEIDDTSEAGDALVTSAQVGDVVAMADVDDESEGWFDPRSTMATPPLRNDSCTTVAESDGPPSPGGDNADSTTAATSTSKMTKSDTLVPPVRATCIRSAPQAELKSKAVHKPEAQIGTSTALDTASPARIPVTLCDRTPPPTPANTPVSGVPEVPGQFFRERSKLDADNPDFSCTGNPATVPEAFAVLNTLSQAERAERMQKTDRALSSSSKAKNRPAVRKRNDTAAGAGNAKRKARPSAQIEQRKYPFGWAAKAPPSKAELRRSQSAPASSAVSRPPPLKRTQSASERYVTFNEVLHPERSEREHASQYPKHAKDKAFDWAKLDSKPIEDFVTKKRRLERESASAGQAGRQRTASWPSSKVAQKHPPPLERRKSEGCPPKRGGVRLVLSDLQPRAATERRGPVRRLLPTSVQPKLDPDVAVPAASAAPAAGAEPVVREVVRARPQTIAVDPRVAHEAEATTATGTGPAALASMVPMPASSDTGGYREPPRTDYAPRGYTIPFERPTRATHPVAFAQMRKQKLPVHIKPARLLHARRPAEQAGEQAGEQTGGHAGANGGQVCETATPAPAPAPTPAPQSGRQPADQGSDEWDEFDDRGTGLSWRTVFWGFCGVAETQPARRETRNVAHH